MYTIDHLGNNGEWRVWHDNIIEAIFVTLVFAESYVDYAKIMLTFATKRL